MRRRRGGAALNKSCPAATTHDTQGDMETQNNTLLTKVALAKAMGYATCDGFFRMVYRNTELMQKLCKAGYNKRRKTLTPKEVEIICDSYGYPINDETLYDKD